MHSTVSHGNNTYVFSVDKHREHNIFALNTSEPILRLTALTSTTIGDSHYVKRLKKLSSKQFCMAKKYGKTLSVIFIKI